MTDILDLANIQIYIHALYIQITIHMLWSQEHSNHDLNVLTHNARRPEKVDELRQHCGHSDHPI
jgi:hypothetical protein